MQSIREDIHRYPELRFEEFKTSERCASELNDLGIDVRKNVGKTGVVGTMEGNRKGRVIAFRAEMDALPMQDMCGASYQSESPNVAHLCGHDGHVASLLGAASILEKIKNHLNGTVKFLFEPSEEATPVNEYCGAEAMIIDGALKNPDVDAVFGGHFFPDWKAGTIALKSGVVFSGNDVVHLKISGREAHSAVPHDGVDAIYVAGQIITATQGLVSQLDVDEAISLHWNTIHGGRVSNLIAGQVVLEGSFRFSNPNLRAKIPNKIENLIKGICDSFGATYELDYFVRPMPAVINSKNESFMMRQTLIDVLGKDAVVDMKQPRLAADTMFHWLQKKNGVFYMVGTADDTPKTQYPSHHQKFDISPKTYPVAVAAIVLTAYQFLNETS